MKNSVRASLWRALGLAGLAAGAGAVALAFTFRPADLELPRVDVGSLPAAAPPAGMSLSALPTGSYDSPAALTFRGGSWAQTRHLAAAAVLIRHPRGNILVDTGFARNVEDQMRLLPVMQRSRYTKGTPVLEQLALAGLHPQDLAGVIPTHVHWDHIGALEELRGVPVIESDAGRAFIASRAPGTEVINSLTGIVYRRYAFDGGAYLGFARSHDLFGDGSLVIVPAPGHTPDSVIVFVTLPSGQRYALIGDATFQEEGVTLPAEKPWLLRWLIGEDRTEVIGDIARVRAAHEKFPQIHVIPAHDMSAFSALPLFPAQAG